MEDDVTRKLSYSWMLWFVLVSILVSGSAFAQMKIGYIDSQRILATFSDAVNAQKILEGETAQVAEELKKMEEELRAENDKLEQQSLLLNEEKKREKAQELQQKYMQIQQYGQQKQQELGQRQEELLQPVFNKINNAINALGEAEGFDFIFNGAVSGTIVFAKPEYDLTEKLLQRLVGGVR